MDAPEQWSKQCMCGLPSETDRQTCSASKVLRNVCRKQCCELGVKGRLWTMQCSGGYSLFLISLQVQLLFLSHFCSWSSSSCLLLVAWAIPVILFSFQCCLSHAYLFCSFPDFSLLLEFPAPPFDLCSKLSLDPSPAPRFFTWPNHRVTPSDLCSLAYCSLSDLLAVAYLAFLTVIWEDGSSQHFKDFLGGQLLFGYCLFSFSEDFTFCGDLGNFLEACQRQAEPCQSLCFKAEVMFPAHSTFKRGLLSYCLFLQTVASACVEVWTRSSLNKKHAWGKKDRAGCEWGGIMFSWLVTHLQPFLECESDDLPLLVIHSSAGFIQCAVAESDTDHLDCETDHTLFLSKLLPANSLF